MLYKELLFLHGIIRWLVLILLLLSVVVAGRGLLGKRAFTKPVNALRHWTATAAHIQLMIGIVLYMKSPFVKMYFAAPAKEGKAGDGFFFAIFHIGLMLAAIVILTVGAAMAKRKQTGHEQYSTMLKWYCMALLLILVAIPWPFSPLSARPLFRIY